MKDIVDRLRGVCGMSLFANSVARNEEIEDQRDCAAREIETLRSRVAELERERDKLQDALAITRNACASRKAQRDEYRRMAECAAIMAVCGYFSRMRGPDFYAYQFPTCVRFSADTYNGSRPLHAIPLYAGSAPVPAAQDFSLMQGGYCCECGHELCDTCAPLHPIMPWPAAQAEAKVADDVRLGNRLYVWDYENPEDGSWDNIEEYLHDTTPGVGDVVRLNLAMPLQDVEVEMLEVGECGEPIRWEVRDVKTGAMLAAKAKEGS